MSRGNFFEFQASLVPPGRGFCWHPKTPHVGGCWAKKEDAQRFAFYSQEKPGAGYYSNAKRSVPLHCVGRVGDQVETRSGAGQGTSVSFDYGHMKDIEWAFGHEHTFGLRFFDDEEEYARLLVECQAEYEVEEAAAQKAKDDDQQQMRDTLNETFQTLWGENDPPEGPTLIISADTDATGLLIRTCKPDRLVFRGMGTFLKDWEPGEVVITETARRMIGHGRPVGGLTGMNFHAKTISWFGYSAASFAPITDIYVGADAWASVRDWPLYTGE